MKFSGLLRFITPHRRVLYSILGLLLIGSLVSLLNPWIAGQFTGSLIGDIDTRFPGIHFILLAWLGLIAFKSILAFATQYLIGSTGETITANLRGRLYDHIQALALSYYHQQRA